VELNFTFSCENEIKFGGFDYLRTFGQPKYWSTSGLFNQLSMLENFNEIRVETPIDVIIRQIQSLISSGQLAPGDKLPPERKLSERLGVGRTQVRNAIKKLEFYGILKTIPQSGTVVAGMGMNALEGLITDVLKIQKSDFESLVETRLVLETNTAQLAAERRTTDDIIAIQMALRAYDDKVRQGHSAVEEDLLFHLKIAEASKNSVLNSLMLIITPDIVSNFVEFNVCTQQRYLRASEEHNVILDHIINKNGQAASLAMTNHLNDVVSFSKKKFNTQ